MPDMPRDPERTRGRYAVTLDGRPAGMDERFVLGDIAPGVWRVRSTRITARPTSRLESDVRDRGRRGCRRRAAVGRLGRRRRARGPRRPARAGRCRHGHEDRRGHGVRRPRDRRPARRPRPACAGPLVLAALDGVDVVEPVGARRGRPGVVPRAGCDAVDGDAHRRGTVVVVGGVEHAGTAYDRVDERTRSHDEPAGRRGRPRAAQHGSRRRRACSRCGSSTSTGRGPSRSPGVRRARRSARRRVRCRLRRRSSRTSATRGVTLCTTQPTTTPVPLAAQCSAAGGKRLPVNSRSSAKPTPERPVKSTVPTTVTHELPVVAVCASCISSAGLTCQRPNSTEVTTTAHRVLGLRRDEREHDAAERELLDEDGAERDVEQRLAGGLGAAHLGDALVGEQVLQPRDGTRDADHQPDDQDDAERPQRAGDPGGATEAQVGPRQAVLPRDDGETDGRRDAGDDVGRALDAAGQHLEADHGDEDAGDRAVGAEEKAADDDPADEQGEADPAAHRSAPSDLHHPRPMAYGPMGRSGTGNRRVRWQGARSSGVVSRSGWSWRRLPSRARSRSRSRSARGSTRGSSPASRPAPTSC